MTKIITENFRVENAVGFSNSFDVANANAVSGFTSSLETYDANNALGLSNTNIEDISGFVENVLTNLNPEHNYYIMASSVDADDPIANTQKQKREFLSRVIFGNKLTSDNIKYIFDNTPWVANTVYESFDDEKDVELTNMYVTVLDGDLGEGPYKVFKCIRNNTNSNSTVAPSTADLDTNYETTLSDGYVWKYMFDVPASEYLEYSVPGGLPYVANTTVIDAAEENISDIQIEQAQFAQFAGFLLGDTTIESVELAGIGSTTYEILLRTSVEAYSTGGAYVGTYLRIIDPGQAESVYDIINSSTVEGDPNALIISVSSPSLDLTSTTPTLVNKVCTIVPKIIVSQSTGRQCIAYGELDQSGTLSYIDFVDKGSEYKIATATLSLPEVISDTEGNTLLRPVVSSRGGHGSDPVSEMYMSRVSSVTSFVTSVVTNIPDTGTYTKVGLVKDPSFYDGLFPNDFDNRQVITANTDLTSTVLPNYRIEQTVGDELITAIIHDATYDANTDLTTFYLVDYDGPYAGEFQVGNADAKASITATEVQPVTINTIDTKKYVAFTGDLLHFIDFDPIERQTDRKEKIKFIFDF